MPTSTSRAQWLLAALSHASTVGLTPVQLQKSLFLLGEGPCKNSTGFYQFSPYDYGPFCQEIYGDAEGLVARGLLEVDVSSGRSTRRFRVTSTGREAVQLDTLPSDANNYLREVVKWAESLSFRDLVKAIYARFPEQRQNSVFTEA